MKQNISYTYRGRGSLIINRMLKILSDFRPSVLKYTARLIDAASQFKTAKTFLFAEI